MQNFWLCHLTEVCCQEFGGRAHCNLNYLMALIIILFVIRRGADKSLAFLIFLFFSSMD
jgi:hypothetical protein